MGIGARITAIFGLAALVLSVSMGGLSYFTTRHFLLAERESAAQNQAFANALLVRSSLSSPTFDKKYASLLSSLDGASDSNSILVLRSQTYYPRSHSISASSLPAELKAEVLAGGAATQTYISRSRDHQPLIVVGVPIPSVNAIYFEVFSLADLAHTLRVIGTTLIVTGFVTTMLGLALGRFASRRALRPLSAVSRAAVAIAGGRLDTRLEAEAADPDLEGLTSSFNTMVDQLQARIQREARFNSDVSHELRSPLTTLAASLEVLETDRDDLPPRAQRALQLLGDDLRRFQRMVADLLEMSRADAGSADVFLEEVSVSELVERSVEAGVRNLGAVWPTPAVLIGPDVESVHVGVDKRRFERVMANLLENAANYGGGATVISVLTVGPDGSRGPSVNGAVGTEADNEHEERGERRHRAERPERSVNAGPGENGTHAVVEIAVEDAGPGISAIERTKVFERFYRGSAAGRRGAGSGTGLGLALVAEHVRLMHGETWVESSPTGGARFVISLPVLEDDEGLEW
jgi:two-component system, OmpR family, sensor histidine kinase MtrB